MHGRARRKSTAQTVKAIKWRLVLATSGKESQMQVMITSTEQKSTSEPRRPIAYEKGEMCLTYQGELRVHANDEKHEKKQDTP